MDGGTKKILFKPKNFSSCLACSQLFLNMGCQEVGFFNVFRYINFKVLLTGSLSNSRILFKNNFFLKYFSLLILLCAKKSQLFGVFIDLYFGTFCDEINFENLKKSPKKQAQGSKIYICFIERNFHLNSQYICRKNINFSFCFKLFWGE